MRSSLAQEEWARYSGHTPLATAPMPRPHLHLEDDAATHNQVHNQGQRK